jgi:alpha-ketoglutarate-dependent taurine dioxygenase/4-hydroxybenzoate polyprenyltransferase
MRETPLKPFGLLVEEEGGCLEDFSAEKLHRLVAAHRVVVFRGLKMLSKLELPAAARRLGPLHVWDFGAVNELHPKEDTKNYLYTSRKVPLHWDGAFAKKVPRYLFFQCAGSDGAEGGETVFVDTTRIWAAASLSQQDRWRSLAFRYETEKKVHYGGSFVARLVAQHPHLPLTTLRFAEPVDDLNPVTVQAENLSPLESGPLITELRELFYQPEYMLLHRWQTGDLLIADNHALLHGRTAFQGKRHLRRVNICALDRTGLDFWKDSLAIRRPEFMVAEIPILLIPLLWTGGDHASGWLIAEVVVLFFLLFHWGDMVNCLADRDADAVYKTRLSEAIYGLGVRNVGWQLGLTGLGAVLLTLHLSWLTAQWLLLPLVLAGLLMGHQYSFGPLRAKSQGLLQILMLMLVIFVGPMLLVALCFSAILDWKLLLLIGCYAAMQEGIILVNTAEDLPEDREAGLYTSAIALGLKGSVGVAAGLVGAGGLGVIGLVLEPVRIIAVLPLLCAWGWVLVELLKLLQKLYRKTEEGALTQLRARSGLVPVWIAATAWATLFAVWARL